jgi:hypothetical protein
MPFDQDAERQKFNIREITEHIVDGWSNLSAFKSAPHPWWSTDRTTMFILRSRCCSEDNDQSSCLLQIFLSLTAQCGARND